jgi:hypothetical protein
MILGVCVSSVRRNRSSVGRCRSKRAKAATWRSPELGGEVEEWLGNWLKPAETKVVAGLAGARI